jgi:hypothetical protein
MNVGKTLLAEIMGFYTLTSFSRIVGFRYSAQLRTLDNAKASGDWQTQPLGLNCFFDYM